MSADTPLVNPNMMDAVDTPYTVKVKKTSNKRLHQWKRADVLVAIKDEYDLDNSDIRVIEQNEVSGPVFLGLTREDLCVGLYSLSYG